MIRYRKARKKDLPLLIEYKLLTITPYIKNKEEQLKVIVYVSTFLKENYEKANLIIHNFKIIGCYLIIKQKLDTLYIIDAYQNKKIGSKIIRKEKENIKEVKVRKENKKAINFYKKNGFTKEEKQNDYMILRKDWKYENERISKTNCQWY